MKNIRNKWLDSTIDTYINHFGKTNRPIIYDVGSRDGHDGFELALRIYEGNNIWHDSEIVLFECNPPQIEVIKTNYPNATLVTEAISDTKGVADFLQIHGDKDMVGSSTMNIARNDNWIKKTKIIKVPTRPLDDVIRELSHQNVEIDIMKIDIEGFTYEALVSLGKYLRNVRVFHLETEIEGYSRQHSNLDIALFMEQQGYLCTALDYEWPPAIQDQVYIRQGDK